MAPLMENPAKDLWDRNNSFSSTSMEEAVAPKPNEPCVVDRKVHRRSVSFATSISVREIMHVNDMEEEDIANVWYNGADFALIKKSMVATVRLMVANKPISAEECTRGLEFRTPAGAKLRKKTKLDAVTAVWLEQVSQWEDETNDIEAIAETYRQYSVACKQAARRAGMLDANYVQNNVLQDVNGVGGEIKYGTSLIKPTKCKESTSLSPSKDRRRAVREDIKQLTQPRRSSCAPSAA